MYYWSPYHPYAPYLPLNGIPPEYYYPPHNFGWQFRSMPSNTFPDTTMNYLDHSESKGDMKTEIPTLKAEETEREEEKTKVIAKKSQIKEARNTNATRNIKANILKDFFRSIKKDATQVLIALKILNSSYSVKRFIQKLAENLPSEGKYIRTKIVIELCKRKGEDQEFALILRIVLRNFLKGEYRNFVVLKRKNCFEYLRICRQIQEKLYKEKCQYYRKF